MTWLSLKERTTDQNVIAACREMSDFDGTSSESFYEVMKEHGLIEKTNVQLKADIMEWQTEVSNLLSQIEENPAEVDDDEYNSLFEQAQELLLRANLSL